MEPSVPPQRRGQDAAVRPVRLPTRLTRDRRHQHASSLDETPVPSAPLSAAKIRARRENIEQKRATDQTSAPAPQPTGDSRHSRHFTVSSVGTGGTLYLQPTQYAPNKLRVPSLQPRSLASRTATATKAQRQDRSSGLSNWSSNSRRASYIDRTSGNRILGDERGISARGSLSAAARRPGRARSHSFSTVSEHVRASLAQSNDAPLSARHDDRGMQRRKSTADLPNGLLDLHIPHYRLGTPRFSAHGTAYLHTSIYTTSSSGVRTSVLDSPADENVFFGMPPATRPSFLHPSTAYRARPNLRRALPSARGLYKETISPAIFDWLENNLHDPTVVQYHANTGRVFAATPARLIAQITSPQFLDYELLADFFLTFRCFMPSSDVLEYLLARMQWAFDSNAEAGRIVRVRTFVALRHWILNYFSDDFLPDWSLRTRFCGLVNSLASNLQQRQDKGGSDLNILGELKKCWRRTCALYWHVPDAVSTSANIDIIPGGQQIEAPAMDSVVSLPLTIRPTTRSGSIFEMAKPFVPEDRTSIASSTADAPSTATSVPHPAVQAVRFHNASIPASPMSEESLDILSCSVPFLRHLRPSHHTREKSAASSHHPPLSGKASGGRGHKHKRSGSFSDALRDHRNPLPSTQPETFDLSELPDFAFTGGLVRGILLQPSPARLHPLPHQSGEQSASATVTRVSGDPFADKQHRNPGVKRIVGDVRRALSSRNKHSGSPVRISRSASSSESRLTGIPLSTDAAQSSPSKSARQTTKQDMLAAVIEASYQTAFQEMANFEGPPPEAPEVPLSDAPARASFLGVRLDRDRGESHITTGSRSILIFDDTGGPDLTSIASGPHTHHPAVSDAQPEQAPQWPMTLNVPHYDETGRDDGLDSQSSVDGSREKLRWQSFDDRFHDLLINPRSSADGRIQSETLSARRSSGAHPAGLELPPIQHQLRRRPGGDLKTAIHVHELENVARSHHSIATFSSMNPSRKPSAAHSRNMSDMTHRFKRGSMLHAHVRNSASLALPEPHSGQSNAHPSFGTRLDGFKSLPDRDSHMGIEDALMKLEGKIPSPAKSTFSSTEHDSGAEIPGFQVRQLPAQLRNITPPSKNAANVSPDGHSPTQTETQGASIFHLTDSADTSLSSRMGLPLTAHATASSTSVIPMAARISRFPVNDDYGSERPVSTQRAREDAPSSSQASVITVERPANSSHSHRSFLLNDDESLSDISTEIADPDDVGFRTFFFDDSHEDATVATNPFLPPPIMPPAFSNDASRSALDRGTMPSPRRFFGPSGVAASQPQQNPVDGKGSEAAADRTFEAGRTMQASTGLDHAMHMPFVLAFDSDVIAEQLTIIEKDALDEVDWKDLIGLHWRQNPDHARNWVDYLKQESPNGIDILIARFNLVVKWVISEIVLINTPRERAHAIAKFIEVADQTHRLHNYASVYQITLALLSSDLAGLRKTWALVGAREKQRLAELEQLCQPLRNFHNLRREMETTAPDAGCIPFIGLYTHDLMINAQRPARVMPPIPAAQQLVNFERFQNAAAIVKSLLRLIEASAKYVFRPHPEVLSRCLWIAALDDSEIVVRCAGLERA